MKNVIRAGLAAGFLSTAGLLSFSAATLAATDDAMFDVTVTVTRACTISADGDIQVTGITTDQATDSTGSNTVTINCGGAGNDVDLVFTSENASSGTTGTMDGDTDEALATLATIDYTLTENSSGSATSVTFGSTIGVTTVLGDTDITVEATVAAGSYTAGDYSETVTATMTY